MINLVFNDSNLYFPNATLLQSSIGFINPMDIDIYVKKSFGAVQDNTLIYGGYIQVFNSSHVVDDTFIAYQIQLANNQPMLKTEGKITFNLENEGFFSGSNIKKTIQGLPLISMLILSLMTLILPASIALIFRYISIIGMLVAVLFYGWKTMKMLYDIITSKGIDYNGVTVYYEKNTDMLTINKEYIQMLKELSKMEIPQIVLINGVFYLKQHVRKLSTRQTIKSIFKSGITDDAIVVTKIQHTIEFLLTTSFIGSYAPIINATQPISQN